MPSRFTVTMCVSMAEVSRKVRLLSGDLFRIVFWPTGYALSTRTFPIFPTIATFSGSFGEFFLITMNFLLRFYSRWFRLLLQSLCLVKSQRGYAFGLFNCESYVPFRDIALIWFS